MTRSIASAFTLLSPGRLALRIGALVAVAVAAYAGWRAFWFLTDDAFITFRYIDQHVRGRGYTWNPPPFRPVEGYSNFLWMVLLEGVWRLTGVEPPRACNVLSLLFSYGTLALGFRMAWRLTLARGLHPLRFVLTIGVLTWTVSNRTFLAWMSSGLETALFVFAVTAWIHAVLEAKHSPRTWALASSAAAIAALTRPDGLLLALATGALLLLTIATARDRLRLLFAGLPLLAVPLHLLWRHAYYGEWVPNTYFAKHVAPWPESGVLYLASFLIEYGLGLWLLLALVALPRWLGRVRRLGLRGIRHELPLITVTSVLLAHAGYYALIIGGDHFEYRILAHLVLPLGLSTVALVSALAPRRSVALAVLTAALLCSLPIPWVHWAQTRNLTSYEETHLLIHPVAPSFPGPLRPYANLFDHLQAALIPHFVCMRHQEHKAFFQRQVDEYPTRAEGERITSADLPVIALRTVGVPGWVMPNVAILDVYGLNDRVVARTPIAPEMQIVRRLAHDREPPPGYFECFEPNLKIEARAPQLAPRPQPLTPDRIHACEARFDPGAH